MGSVGIRLVFICAVVALGGTRVEAEEEKTKATEEASPNTADPVDPYLRDPNAPMPPPGEARAWDIRPSEGHRPEIRWVKQNATQGVKYTMITVFAPMEGALWLTRKFSIVRRVENILYLGSDDRRYGILPTVSFQSGFGVALGATAFHKDLFGYRERLAAKLSYGGLYDNLAQVSLDAPSIAGSRFYFEGLHRFEGLSELFFYGIGNGAENPPLMGEVYEPRDASVTTVFRQERTLAMAAAGRHFGQQGRRLRLGVSAIYNNRRFGVSPNNGKHPAIEEVYDTSKLASFEDGEDIFELSAEMTLDTRDLGGKTGSGLLLDTFFGGAPSSDGNQFLHYGIDASYYLTIFRESRVLIARLFLEAVEPGAGEVPFTELPRLGGADRLRGYRSERFRDQLATVATLEYRYPIHHLVSGVLFTEAGKVAQSYDELWVAGISDNWKPAIGFGFLVHTLTDAKFRLEFSYGESLEIFFSTDALAAFRDRKRRL